MPHPCKRLRLADELGVPQTVPGGHDVVNRAPGQEWLILGLGPDPLALAATLPPQARVRYLECPAFWEQAGMAWREAIPASWQRIERFDPLVDQNILLANGSRKLFPSFWAPILAALLLPQPPLPEETGTRTVLLVARQGSLIAPDATAALWDAGWTVRSLTDQAGLVECLENGGPGLFLSINFTGLDRYGEVQAVLARAGVPVAVWCVDNPFHSLSGVKTNAWKDLHLFVTDDWFIEPLRQYGARHVHHLPLAAGRHFLTASPDRPDLADKLLYVGHSAVADKDLFFSGRSIREAFLDQAKAMLDDGQRPDFGWWTSKLGLARLWPGLQSRSAGIGAEESTRLWRARVLTAAAGTGRLAICGDAAWRDLVDRPFEFLPAQRYHGALAGFYASAKYVIGAASLLLPHGLSQRHFDVWAAGGCLLTDDTPGLSLFPPELTRPITYRTASQAAALARSLEPDRAGLIRAWRELIAREHTYSRRIRTLLERIAG
jgi:hypothetical protein